MRWLIKSHLIWIYTVCIGICTSQGWLDEVLLCILHHRGVQLILAYSWDRPAILAAGKGRGGLFLFLASSLLFIFLFLPCSLLSHLLYSLLSLFSLSLGDDTKWPTRVDPKTINFYQSTGLKGLTLNLLGLR